MRIVVTLCVVLALRAPGAAEATPAVGNFPDFSPDEDLKHKDEARIL